MEISAYELGIGLDRPLTVTGGLSFAGGPWNNYVTHSIATMADRLREEPGSVGLVSANGGFITKHAFGVYGTEPPATPFQHADVQAEVDALPKRELCEEPDGEVAIETWTAMHDRDGNPETGIVVGLLDDGRRAIGTTQDADALKVLVTEDLAGRRARIAPDGATDAAVARARYALRFRFSAARASRTFIITSRVPGISSSSFLKATMLKASSCIGVCATTLALRGLWPTRAISPTIEPGPMSAMC